MGLLRKKSIKIEMKIYQKYKKLILNDFEIDFFKI